MPNKTTKKHTKPKQNLSQKQRKFILIAIAVLIALGVVYWMTRNTSLRQVDKQELIAETQDMMDSIQLDGELVASELEDLGCSGRNAVGIAYYVHCDIKGYKYYKISNDVSTVLRSVDGYLLSLGWVPTLTNNEDEESRGKILDGERANSLRYVSPTGRRISVEYYREDGYASDFYLKQAIVDGSMQRPNGGEIVYGINVGGTYYSCRGNSIFTQPCPAPPSEPR